MRIGGELLGRQPIFNLALSLDRLMPRFARSVFTRPSQMAIDALLAAGAFWYAYVIRFDGIVPAVERQQFAITVGFVVALYVGVNLIRSQYTHVWRFFNLED